MLSLLKLYVYLCTAFMLLNWLVDGIIYILCGEIEEDEE